MTLPQYIALGLILTQVGGAVILFILHKLEIN